VTRRPETVGLLIDDRYKLLRLMGEGGMGRVYEAEHVGIGKQVAVKILHATFSHVDDLVARFRQEARIATQIGDAHIVDVTDSGMTEDGRFFFVMEYLDGIELDAAIRGGPLELGRALHITRQIADALGVAHDQGVIHRDLKPENILLVEREGDPDFVKVLDFGIAKTMDADRSQRKLTQPGLAMGTPEYVAPEQALALTTDARSDIYSLGAILYELVTGAQPYRADTYTQVLVLKSTTEPQPPRELRDDLPLEVQEIILKAMARQPDDRHQTMAEMSYEITKVLQGREAAVSRVIGLPAPPTGLTTSSVDAPQVAPTATKAGDESILFHSEEPQRARVEEVPVAPPVDVARATVRDESILIDYEEPESTPAERAPLAAPVDVARATAEETEPSSATRRVTGRTWALLLVLAMVGAGAYWYLYEWVPAREEAGRPAARAAEAPRPLPPDTPSPPIATAAPAAIPTALPPDAAPTVPTPAVDAAPPHPDGGAGGDAATAPPKPPPRAARTVKEARAFIARAAKAAAGKDWEAARALFDRVARSQHLSELGHLGLARVELADGHADLAIDHATASLRDGGDALARHVLARALAAADRKVEAIKQYRLLLKAQPANRELRRELDGLTQATKKRKSR
jgi:serine/threonine-protein kinase